MKYRIGWMTACFAGALTWQAALADGPIWDGNQLVFPEGSDTPRFLTDAERKYLEANPIATPRGETPPPTGPVHCVAEYEPMEGILLAWESQTTLLTQMTQQITTVGNAKVYMVVDTVSEQNSVATTLSSNGVDLNKVQFVVRATDSVWIRDYGPRYIYEGNCRAVVDHVYNRPRPLDDVLPGYFAGTVKKHAFYEIPLIHGGGNYHLDATGSSFATELIVNENPTLTQQQIVDYWMAYQNLSTTIYDAFPTSVDATQHIDMWMQVIADNKVIISDWPNNVNSTQDQICDAAAADLTARGYTVFRTPARSVSGVHYTYTNAVMCNNLVLVPSYTNTTVSPHNAPALAVWQSALPGHTIVQLNCQSIISLAGAMHCVAMHVPAPPGGENPTVRLQTLRGGATLEPGTQQDIRWISDDDVAVTSIDIHLSLNGGATYPTAIALGTANDGQFTWTVPDVSTTLARLRLTVHDANGNTGTDEGDGDLIINGTTVVLGDMNCDGALDVEDVGPFAMALVDAAAYSAAYPGCDIQRADVNEDAGINGADVPDFVAELLGP